MVIECCFERIKQVWFQGSKKQSRRSFTWVDGCVEWVHKCTYGTFLLFCETTGLNGKECV